MAPSRQSDDADLLANVARIRRLAHGFDQPQDREWVAEAFKRYLGAADDGLTMEDALGLTSDVKAWPWYRSAAIASRDMHIRELARCFCRHPSLAVRTQSVSEMLESYRRSIWAADRRLDAAPAEAEGTPREILWHILKSVDTPLSDRQIRRILAGR